MCYINLNILAKNLNLQKHACRGQKSSKLSYQSVKEKKLEIPWLTKEREWNHLLMW